MIRTRSIAALALLLTAACAGGDQPHEEGASPTPKVLVIGLDGVRPDVMAEVSTPNIDALIADGTYADNAQTGLPSVSGPGWSSFLNGVWPDKHGVTDNSFEGKQYEAFPDFLTRIEQVRPELNTFAVADWLPLVQADDGMPTISNAVNVKHILDGYELGWPEADSVSTSLAARHIRDGDPDALFVYLGNPDETSHHFGSIGTEYREAISLADREVGRLMEAVRSRPTYDQEDWLVVMSTDHGRTEEGGHGGDTPEERTIFLLVSGPSADKGAPAEPTFIVDVSVTAPGPPGHRHGPGVGAGWEGRGVGESLSRSARTWARRLPVGTWRAQCAQTHRGPGRLSVPGLSRSDLPAFYANVL